MEDCKGKLVDDYGDNFCSINLIYRNRGQETGDREQEIGNRK